MLPPYVASAGRGGSLIPAGLSARTGYGTVHPERRVEVDKLCVSGTQIKRIGRSVCEEDAWIHGRTSMDQQ